MTVCASVKYLWVVITHDWTSIEVSKVIPAQLFFLSNSNCLKFVDFYLKNFQAGSEFILNVQRVAKFYLM